MALVLLSAFSKDGQAAQSLVSTFGRGILLTIFLVFISSKLLPSLSSFFAKSQEYLFLFSIAWGFGLATLFSYIGFSVEIGALIAGVALSISPYAQEISSKLKPLREFFIVMFFILLGSGLVLDNFSQIIRPSLIFSLFVLVGDPLIVMIMMGVLGYNRKTGFLAGLSMAQISEFSLILIALGVQLGHISNYILSIVTLVGIITIALSSYLIMYGERLYAYVEKYLKIFEKKRAHEEMDFIGNYDIILFGGNRVGYDFIKTFKHFGQAFLCVDFDPDIVSELKQRGINCKYGDAEDSEFLDDLKLAESKIVVSTIPDFDTNLFILKKVRDTSAGPLVILISYNLEEAIKLYDRGASYVVMPHFISGEFAAKLARDAGYGLSSLSDKKKEHIAYLHERKALGHVHPTYFKSF